jgi:hypothetical protein
MVALDPREHTAQLDEQGYPMTPQGGTSKYTPEREAIIIQMLRQGMPRSWAAQAAGIHRRTFYDWLEAYPAFAQKVEEAETELRRVLVSIVMQEALKKQNWVTAMTMLERRWPEEFGRHNRLEVTGEGGGPVQTSNPLLEEMAKLVAEQRRQLAEQRLKVIDVMPERPPWELLTPEQEP